MATSKHIPIQLPLPFDDTIIIPLTQCQFATVDRIDADLAEHKWQAMFDPSYRDNGQYKATRTITPSKGKQAIVYMHRVILSRKLGRPLLRSEECDHWDTDPLNNRRDNLRLATRSQNVANQTKRKNTTSNLKGVSWYKKTSKWKAQISDNGKVKHLGYFDTPEEAHAKWWEEAQRIYGKFARSD